MDTPATTPSPRDLPDTFSDSFRDMLFSAHIGSEPVDPSEWRRSLVTEWAISHPEEMRSVDRMMDAFLKDLPVLPKPNHETRVYALLWNYGVLQTGGLLTPTMDHLPSLLRLSSRSLQYTGRTGDIEDATRMRATTV